MSDLLSRVLLVEDDEGDALLVRECLIEAGVPEVDVLWQRTLADGIAALAEAPGCVLLDLGLPDAEGLGALHGLVGEAVGIPVIVLTGRNDRTGVEAVAAGAQDYLVKDDITPELLDRSIRYAVERSRAQATELALREEQMLSAENSRLERGLLPRPLLRDDFVECATYYQPGRNLAVLGGDFYDVVQTPDGRVRAVVGDVMGHGPDEAALGVHLRVAWRTLVLAGAPDETILTSMSRLLSAETSSGGRFVTACDITIDADRSVTLRVAGHPAPLVCSAGRASLPRSRDRSAAGHRRTDRRRAPLAAERWLAGVAHAVVGRIVDDPLHRRPARRLPRARQSRQPRRRRTARRDQRRPWPAAARSDRGCRRSSAAHRSARPTTPPSSRSPCAARRASERADRDADMFADWPLRKRVASWFLTLVVLLVIAFATVLYATLQFKNKGDDDHRPLAAGVRDQPDAAERHGQPGDRPARLRPRQASGRSCSRIASTRRCSASTRRSCARCSPAIPALTADLAAFDRARRPRGARTSPRSTSPRCGAAIRHASGLVSDLAGKASFDKIRRARRDAQRPHRGGASTTSRAQRRAAIVFCFIATIAAAVLTLGSKYVLVARAAPSGARPDRRPRRSRPATSPAVRSTSRSSRAARRRSRRSGRDVDSMRARIASELARVERARVGLLERGEELARSNADLEQFAYVASHDLSEPLRKVANFCQLLERQYGDQLDDKAKQYIAFAVDGAKRMQVLIADLLVVLAGRAHHRERSPPVDTGIALSRALVDARRSHRRRPTRRSCAAPLPTVDGDATLLTALFQNLIGNAVKYRDPDRPPRIEISRRATGANWQFTVADNGIGIDRQYAERIFTIFQRLHLRDKYGGTGIGLALCRKIVEFHRGKIWLAESDGPGATFAFLIPEHSGSAIRPQRRPRRDGGRQ